MSYMNAGCVRIGFVTLIAAILTVGISGDALAKAHKGRVHAHRTVVESRAEIVSEQPSQPGAPRYYGGPKSPMWR
jgi:hypothetical protein